MLNDWMVFLGAAAVIVLAGSRLSRDGDAIAERSGLGSAWIGAVLVAGATSLPELCTDWQAVKQGHRALAVGDLFGSCMANVLLIGLADLCTRDVDVLNRVRANQVLVASVGIAMLVLAILGSLSPLQATVLGIGWSPWVIAIGYIFGMRLLHVNRGEAVFEDAGEHAKHLTSVPTLPKATLGFLIASGAIIATAPFLAASAAAIAGQLGISGGFAGMVLLALTTSLPEIAVSISAARAGSYDMVVGNLLGSNCFNMAILWALDLADGPGSLLTGLDGGLLTGGLFAVILTALVILGILNKSENPIRYLEPTAWTLVIVYAVGLWMTYLSEPKQVQGHTAQSPSSRRSIGVERSDDFYFLVKGARSRSWRRCSVPGPTPCPRCSRS